MILIIPFIWRVRLTCRILHSRMSPNRIHSTLASRAGKYLAMTCHIMFKACKCALATNKFTQLNSVHHF